MKKMRMLGIGLIILSIILIVPSMSFTGFVIGEDVQAVFRIIGAAIFLGGLFIMMLSEQLESKVKVFRRERGGKEVYEMTDPYGHVTSGSSISLGEFKDLIKSIRKDEEVYSNVRNAYAPQLIRIVKRGGDEAEIAQNFLNILELSKEAEKETLNPDEREEIKRTFRDYKNKPNAEQRKVLEKYNLDYKTTGKHGKIYWIENPDIFATAPLTASDWRATRNFPRQIIEVINKIRKMKSGKKA